MMLHSADLSIPLREMKGTLAIMRGDRFDEAYFRTYYGIQYLRDRRWLNFYGGMADQIVRTLKPRSVFDAGCAMGMLVEALWDRGLEARGADISSYAISNARPDMRAYCELRSISEPIEGRYDLITCIQVLEFLSDEEAEATVANLSRATDRVLFSEAGTDSADPAHSSAHPTIYWLNVFAANGFWPDLLFDASFLGPRAVLFVRRDDGTYPDSEILGMFSEVLRVRSALVDREQKVYSVSAEVDASAARLQSLERELSDTTEEVETMRSLVTERESQAARLSAELAAIRSLELPEPEADAASFFAGTVRTMDGGDADATEAGERVTPDWPNWGYWAHLSIYDFASQFITGRRVLDAGCGTGYGADHMRRRGAQRVCGIDNSVSALEYCRSRYGEPGLDFVRADLTMCDVSEFARFEVALCSHVLEHLWGLDDFLSKLAKALPAEGVLVAAVPVLVTPGMLEENLKNPYHLNNYPPETWLRKLARFFTNVEGYRHWVGSEWLDANNQPKQMYEPPATTTIRETDFTFTAMTPEEMGTQIATITSVLIARVPRRSPLPPLSDSELPADWDLDAIRARVVEHCRSTLPRYAREWEGKVVAAIDHRGQCRNLYQIRNGIKHRVNPRSWESPLGFGWPGGVKAVHEMALAALPDSPAD